MTNESQQPESYEPTSKAQQRIVRDQIHAAYENLFSLQVQHRVHKRLKNEDSLKSIEAAMAKQEEAIVELRIILSEIEGAPQSATGT